MADDALASLTRRQSHMTVGDHPALLLWLAMQRFVKAGKVDPPEPVLEPLPLFDDEA